MKRKIQIALFIFFQTSFHTAIAQCVRKEIRDREINFAFAYPGEEVLVYLKSLNYEAVLILPDINMPGVSGLVLLKQIKRILKTSVDCSDGHFFRR